MHSCSVNVLMDMCRMRMKVNSVTWRFALEVKNHGLVVVRTATVMAVCLFSDSTTSQGHTLKKLSVEVQEICERLVFKEGCCTNYYYPETVTACHKRVQEEDEMPETWQR